MSGDVQTETVKLWDPLLRGFHWILAALVISNWLIGQFASNLWLHFWLGYGVVALLIFRVVWGFVGPPPARFSHFIKGPGAIIGYASRMFRREPSYCRGHNPLGALSVLAMLGVLFLQTGSGLIADPQDYINVGPLADKVSGATSKAAVGWHDLGATLILILVILHVGIILFYRFWKHENLIRPMITGWKTIRRR